MTLRPARTLCHKLRDAAATLLLSAPLALCTTPAVAAGPTAYAPSVYPRASVSSEAYRTAVYTVTPRPVTPAMATTATREPARLVANTSARPIPSQPQIIPVAHRDVQQVNSPGEGGHSVRSELQKLYEEEGRQMPRMATPSYQHSVPAHAQANGQAAPAVPSPDELTYRHKQPGLLAGLFDFGRRTTSRPTRGGAAPMRPPVEPTPFQPPTYRQQPRRQTAQARPAQSRTPQTQSPAVRQQATATTRQSASVVKLKKNSWDRNFATPDDAFFPEEPQQQVAIIPNDRTAVTAPLDDLAEFFPADVPTAQPQVQSAADTAAANVKEQMQEPSTAELSPPSEVPPQAVSDETDTAVDSDDDFKMPELAEEDIIIPQPAPAVASEVVTTTVIPSTTDEGLAEPAPFFADDERAIDPQEELNVAALTGQTFDPSGADSAATAGTVAAGGSLMQQIAAREGVGLKGFCPVALRDERRLADGRAAYVSFYRGKAYYFSSATAKDKFDSAPGTYAPASSGEDITTKTLTGEVVEGSLDHSVWYKDKLYLFQSAENLNTFMAAPSAMAVLD